MLCSVSCKRVSTSSFAAVAAALVVPFCSFILKLQLSSFPASSCSLRFRSPLFRATLAFDRQQHLLLACASFARLLALGSRFAGEAFLQGIHEVHHVLPAGAWLGANALSLTLCINEFGKCRFVVILKLLRLEGRSPLVDDMPRQLEHILGDFHVLNAIEVFLLVAHLVWVAQQHAHQALAQRL